VWYVTVDVSVTEHAKVIRGLTQGIKDLAANLGNAPVQRQELRYMGMIARELQKMDNILQMLPRERWVKRGDAQPRGARLSSFFSEPPLAKIYAQ
jgi:hypothetical protein